MHASSFATTLTGPARLYDTLEKFWECIGLSVLWLIGALPVITTGGSTLALFRVIAERRDGNYRPVRHAFWAEFTRDLLPRAGATTLTLFAATGIVVTFATGLSAIDPTLATVLQSLALIGALALLGTLTTLLPLLTSTRSQGGGLRTLRVATAIALYRPLTTVAAIGVTIAIGTAIVLLPPLLPVLAWTWARLLLDLHRTVMSGLDEGANAAVGARA